MNKRTGESSATVRRRIVKAREKQLTRMGRCNSHMKAKELCEHCDMDSGTKDLLKAAIAQFNLSGRVYDRILKVPRTLAGLEDTESIEMHHVAEAINYRSFDRKLSAKKVGKTRKKFRRGLARPVHDNSSQGRESTFAGRENLLRLSPGGFYRPNDSGKELYNSVETCALFLSWLQRLLTHPFSEFPLRACRGAFPTATHG